MNRNPNAQKVWSVVTPLIGYWLIRTVIQIVVSLALVAMNAGELSAVGEITSKTTDAEMQNMVAQVSKIMTDIILKYNLPVAIITAAGTIPYTLFLFRRDRKRENITFRSTKSMVEYGPIILLGIAVSIGVNCLLMMTKMAMQKDYTEISELFYTGDVLLQIIGLGIVVPIAEELLFRGVLFRRLRKYITFTQAAIGTSILFAATHGATIQMIYALCLGMLLAYVYEKYQSFAAPAILHITANVISILLTESGMLTWFNKNPLFMAAGVVAAAFFGSSMFVKIQKMQVDIENMIEK